MEKKIEHEMDTRVREEIYVENQMERNMPNEMDTGFEGLGPSKIFVMIEKQTENQIETKMEPGIMLTSCWIHNPSPY